MKTLFIRNLPFDTSEADLRKAFEPYGKVHRCSIAKNRDTGESRGFGFVDIDDDGAPRAIVEMNGKSFSNRTIVVQESDPRPREGGASPSPGSSGPPRTGAPSGPRPGGGPGGPRPAGAGGSGPRPGGPGAGSSGPRPAAPGGMNRSAAPPQSRYAQTVRNNNSGDQKNFGPDAAPAAQRFKAYSDRPKDRLKPYKREHFDFRDALSEDEKREARKKEDEGDE